jgi:hypothetical protein
LNARQSVIEAGRWLLAAAGVVASFSAVAYFVVVFMLFGSFPADLEDPFAGFAFGFFPILIGALLAPRWKVRVAIVLAVVGLALAIGTKDIPLPSAIVGAALAIGFVRWWVSPRRRRVSIPLFAKILGGLVAIPIVLVYARYVDFPAFQDELDWRVAEALGARTSDVKRSNAYELYSFIDSAHLWRIDAGADLIESIIDGLELQPTEEIPPGFWAMPPYYWPRSLPANAKAYRSADFSLYGRGPDGDHHFLVHDRTGNRAFILLQRNF